MQPDSVHLAAGDGDEDFRQGRASSDAAPSAAVSGINPAPTLEIAYAEGRKDEREALSIAARDVLAERERQMSVEGWTPEHDDEHGDHSMAIAAACYALWDMAGLPVQMTVGDLWRWTGWGESWFKPKDPRRNLIRAGALILAEIERMDRAETACLKEMRSAPLPWWEQALSASGSPLREGTRPDAKDGAA